MNGSGARRMLPLTAVQRDAVERGTFVRIDLPAAVVLADGTRAASVLVGRASGVLRAYANVCRHQAIPLDARAEDELAGAMADDGVHLLCRSHGAIYRPDDGMCVSGPCLGAHLLAIAVAPADGDPDGDLAVDLPLGERPP